MPGAFGRHRVLHQIGTGALGPVFRAYDSLTDRVVAVKAFRPSSTPDQIVRVADALRALVARPACHPAAVALVEAGIEGTTPFLVMEWQMGEVLDALRRRSAPLDLGRALLILAPLAAVIDAADDSGAGHGALHPRDVFVQTIGDAAGVETVAVKVAGIGVMQALAEAGLSIPPRQNYVPASSSGDTRRVLDLYAFGVIAHELLTGRRPLGSRDQDGAFAANLTPQMRVQLRRVLSRMLAPESPDGDDRFMSAGAFVEALASITSAPGLRPAVDDAPAKVSETPVARFVAAAASDSSPVTARPEGVAPDPEAASETNRPRTVRSREWNDKFRSITEPQPELPTGHSHALVGVIVALLSVAVGSAASYEYLRAKAGTPTPAASVSASARADTPQPSDTDVSVPSVSAVAPETAPASTPAPAPAPHASESSRPVSAPAPAASSRASSRPVPRKAAPALGALVVTSAPPGAMVTVDGHLTGQTPVTVRDLDLGSHAVLVARPGHVPYRGNVTLASAARAERLYVVLEPGLAEGRPAAPVTGVGMIDVDSRPRGADVRVDGTPAGPSPLRLSEMAPGEHTITLELGGYKIASRRIGVNSGKVSTLSVTLESLVR